MTSPRTPSGIAYASKWPVGTIGHMAAVDFVLAVEREAAAATPSLDWSRVITAVANTMPDDDTFARPEVVAAEYARLDEGSATPDPVWDDIYGEDGTAGSADD